jgi:hypothetical protein
MDTHDDEMKKILSPKTGGKTQPEWAACIKGSFLYQPATVTVGDPSQLLNEIYRLVFSEESNNKKPKLSPNTNGEVKPHLLLTPSVPAKTIKAYIDNPQYTEFSPDEKVAVAASLTRRKLTDSDNHYYAALYPSLSRWNWRSGSPANNTNLVFFDFLRHYFFSERSDLQDGQIGQFVDKFVSCLMGDFESEEGKDIFLLLSTLEKNTDKTKALAKMKDWLDLSLADKQAEIGKIPRRRASSRTTDTTTDLAVTLYNDLEAVLDLTHTLDRLQWIDVFMTYLRLSCPIWLLAKLKMTVILRDMILELLECENESAFFVGIDDKIQTILSEKNNELLNLSLSPTDPITDGVSQYMRAKIELNILCHWVQHLSDDKELWNKTLHHSDLGLADKDFTVEKLLLEFKKAKKKLSSHSQGSIREKLTYFANEFSIYRNPLKSGNGKGLFEFFQVFKNINEGDEGGALLQEVKRVGKKNACTTFPEPKLLKLMVHLSKKEKNKTNASSNENPREPFMLRHVESHFLKYGISLARHTGVRERLSLELQKLGLLKGRPDAGDSVEVSDPYAGGK